VSAGRAPCCGEHQPAHRQHQPHRPYLGHIGYHVEPAYRSRHLAARSCRLSLPLARRHGLHPLWMTCNPDNWASRRTCELAGARLVETVDLPPNNPIYLSGELRKCRYRLNTLV